MRKIIRLRREVIRQLGNLEVPAVQGGYWTVSKNNDCFAESTAQCVGAFSIGPTGCATR